MQAGDAGDGDWHRDRVKTRCDRVARIVTGQQSSQWSENIFWHCGGEDPKSSHLVTCRANEDGRCWRSAPTAANESRDA